MNCASNKLRHVGSMLTALTALLLASPDSLPGAELKVASVFSQNTVLQRDKPVPVWGWADGGLKVTVEFAGQKKAATADAGGRWQVLLSKPCLEEPYRRHL